MVTIKSELTFEEIEIKMEDLHEELILTGTQNFWESQRSQRSRPPSSLEMGFGGLQSQEVHKVLTGSQNFCKSEPSQRSRPPSSLEMGFGGLQSQEVHKVLTGSQNFCESQPSQRNRPPVSPEMDFDGLQSQEVHKVLTGSQNFCESQPSQRNRPPVSPEMDFDGLQSQEVHKVLTGSQNFCESQPSQRNRPPVSPEMDFGGLQSQEVRNLLTDFICTSKYDYLHERASQEPNEKTAFSKSAEVAFDPCEHLSWYGRESPHEWECPKCFARFTRKCVLNKHQRSFRHDFPCPLCASRFAEEAELKEHSNVHMSNPHKCLKCDAEFPTELLLKDHAKKHRKPRSAKPKTIYRVGRKPHRDIKKGGMLRTKKSVDKMLNQEYNMAGIEKTKQICKSVKGIERAFNKSLEEDRKTLICNVCDASFAEEKVLVQHLMAYTKQTATCFHCNAIFKHVDFLTEHIIEFDHMRPFSCVMCYKWFPTLREFYKHECPNYIE